MVKKAYKELTIFEYIVIIQFLTGLIIGCIDNLEIIGIIVICIDGLMVFLKDLISRLRLNRGFRSYE